MATTKIEQPYTRTFERLRLGCGRSVFCIADNSPWQNEGETVKIFDCAATK